MNAYAMDQVPPNGTLFWTPLGRGGLSQFFVLVFCVYHPASKSAYWALVAFPKKTCQNIGRGSMIFHFYFFLRLQYNIVSKVTHTALMIIMSGFALSMDESGPTRHVHRLVSFWHNPTPGGNRGAG